ncbi:MAG: Unknown protein [uncultured Sulfurovum sp.]|uniref:Uncharacterized protein n=1 Tax=uncultured Sulfurovum sp. TaxID=269237 RepID=A0A6S6SPG9_9BACT|nr:MAG: Unknown protein [uncultured Sulfurovum sp.]
MKYLVILVLLTIYSNAQCTKNEILKLSDVGFSKDEIINICSSNIRFTSWITPLNSTCRNDGGKYR